ncbi:MAG: hypothetical protein NZ580_01985 [Bacteroidia bacterium]|nr:hypothetical protein [Bacteroidia bacterium]MDW8235986.1 hypothetical protein [Bacteroidia bacterium]
MRDKGYTLPLIISYALGAWFIYYFLIERTPQGEFVRFLLTDDAMISMNYARSVAEGCGWVWYCGAEKVEGFTNFLWVLYMSLWHKLAIPPNFTSLPIILTGFLTLWLQLHAIYTLGKKIFSPEVGYLAALIAATFLPLVLWHFIGLETGLLMGLTAYLTLRAVQARMPHFTDMLAAIVGVLARMDFLLIVGTIGGFWSYAQRSYVPLLRLGLPSIAALTGLMTWRLHYYGRWLPNTYYLKVDSVPLSLRLLNGVLTAAGSILTNLPLWLLAGWSLWRKKVPSSLTILFGGVPGIMLAYLIYAGGDDWEIAPLTNRFLGLAYPLLVIAAAATIAAFSRLWQGLALIAIALGVGNRWSIFTTLSPYACPLGQKTVSNIFSVFVPYPLDSLGLPPGSHIWLGPAGTTPYFYRGYVYRDYLGKCDSGVARSSPACYITMRFYQWYAPGHTRLGIDKVLRDSLAKAVFISFKGHPGRRRGFCEAEPYLSLLPQYFVYRAPYGWLRRQLSNE